jgi:signal transduction histidine kinase
MTISDDGRGFDQQRIKPRGLMNMRERAIRLGGKCEIKSEIGHGTTI